MSFVDSLTLPQNVRPSRLLFASPVLFASPSTLLILNYSGKRDDDVELVVEEAKDGEAARPQKVCFFFCDFFRRALTFSDDVEIKPER